MLRKYFLLVFCCVSVSLVSFSQVAKPKLVVGIVIDQMRWDYLYRFQQHYSNTGFKRLLKDGFSCENTMIPYMPTYTAPGHTCIYTGSVPAIHGIVGNNWFDKSTNTNAYCTEDATVTTVGSTTIAGKMSPKNLWATTITDELRLNTNFKSKVIGIALKDRGAILPAGHSANAAYWYDDKVGKWITSTYYMQGLPQWVDQFNAKDWAGTYMKQDWNTLLPISQYTVSTADDKLYEDAIKGEQTVTFPHRLSVITGSKYASFKTTPFANTYTFDFAKAAIENEALGKNAVTDFLAVSISATDYIGHSFGPNAIEIEDTYLRLDRDIANFLQYLDIKMGKGNYLVFLTADHGVAHVPDFLAEHKLPGGVVKDADITTALKQLLKNKFQLDSVVQMVENYQVYLDKNEIKKQGKVETEIVHAVIDWLKQQPFIVQAFETADITNAAIPPPQKERMINGYNPKRSGDIQFMFKPGYFDGWGKGTTHGLWNPYDAHIPLVWYGWKIKPGKLYRETYMTDISATLAALLQIQMPNGCIGKVITEVLEK